MTPSPKRCPQCGQDNRCGAAQGASTCWCMAVSIPPEVLQAIPRAQQGVACLCPGCASGAVPSPCVEVCELDAAGQTCRGCGRSLREIAAWPGFTAAEKLAVLRRLARRPADPD